MHTAAPLRIARCKARHPGVQERCCAPSRGVRHVAGVVACDGQRTRVACFAVASPTSDVASKENNADAEFLDETRPVRVLIAGGGIAGLVLAVSLLKKGIDVRVFERDMTAIRGEGKYRGPIQVQSNALGALEAIDPAISEEVMQEGCITGDRVNGLCDGVTGEWYCKFDTYHPAVDNGLPVTRVISRVVLQQILAKYIVKMGGDDVILPDCKVVSFQEDEVNGHKRAWAELESGERFWGDIMIGADGIRSKIRDQLIGKRDATYSGYTCYTGISDFVCPDIDTVAYRVFLGHGQYFVSSDVGGGKMQWYAFHEEAAGGKDVEGKQKARLMEIFGHWNDMVTDLIAATPEEDVIRRDIYDRPPVFQWTKGRVALLGDSAHAMQPNLGQGGCMAIEDAYAFACRVDENLKREGANCLNLPYEQILSNYKGERFLRASAIHGMARMAAYAASTYKAYWGEEYPAVAKLKIPHPGKVFGGIAMKLTMPLVLNWVLGGNKSAIDKDRPGYCNLKDRPRGFREEDWRTLMRDDEALLSAAQADWVLVPMSEDQTVLGIATAVQDNVRIGREGSDICVKEDGVEVNHAHFEVRDKAYYVVDDDSKAGTWLNDRRVKRSARLHPGDIVQFGGHDGTHQRFKVKLIHHTDRDTGVVLPNRDGSLNRFKVAYTRDTVAA